MHERKNTYRNVVYRHFNKDGELLYIGCSEDVYNRNLQHQAASCWYKEIYSIVLEHFDTKEEAIKAERQAILNETPRYNRLALQPENKAEQKKMRDKKAWLWLETDWKTMPYGEISGQSLEQFVRMGVAESRKSGDFGTDYRLASK